MASEAQRLIGISLTKIAQSRSFRGGVSLHKNLLVATVLQKARYIFMEEAYNMVHYHVPVPTPVTVHSKTLAHEDSSTSSTEASTEHSDDFRECASSDNDKKTDSSRPPSCDQCIDNEKENEPPHNINQSSDETSNIRRDRTNSSYLSLKRRRTVAEWETEEAVQSILPKKCKQDKESNDVSECSDNYCDDSVFLDDATILSDIVSKEVAAEKRREMALTSTGSSVEIDRITSLVSIFSFSIGNDGTSKLNRSLSTPDLCSTQAKDSSDSMQRPPYLAMTV